MKGKIIAKVKSEKLDIEKKDQWVSYDGETMDDFKQRMREGGSEPNNFNFTDPVEDTTTEMEYQPLPDLPKSVNLDLSTIYYARQLGLINEQDFIAIKPFLIAGANAYISTIPKQTESLTTAINENKIKEEIKNEPEISSDIEEEEIPVQTEEIESDEEEKVTPSLQSDDN